MKTKTKLSIPQAVAVAVAAFILGQMTALGIFTLSYESSPDPVTTQPSTTLPRRPATTTTTEGHTPLSIEMLREICEVHGHLPPHEVKDIGGSAFCIEDGKGGYELQYFPAAP